MQVEQWPIEKVTPFHNNSRVHDDKSIKAITASVDRFSWLQPIVVDKDGVIVMGHGRREAALQLGMTEVPVLVADWLTDNEVAAAREADNMTQDLSYFDMELLNMNLGEIDWLDIDMSEFGFKLDDELFGEAEEDDYTEDDASAAPSRAQRGDIWQLGEHRLMCGDSTSETDVESLMGGGVSDVVFTDTPYGMDYQSNMRVSSDKFLVIENDDTILDFFPCIKSRCKGFVFVCTTWKVLQQWLSLFTDYYELTNMIIWDKGGGGIGDLKHTFSTDYEIILCANNGAELKGKRIGSVWSVGKDSANDYVHPTQKPVGVSSLAISETTNAGDSVLDLFGGSGSTLIACEQLGRKCYMMELDPHYCDVIIDRWEKLTGEKANRVS